MTRQHDDLRPEDLLRSDLPLEEIEHHRGQVGPDSAGQSGDTQGLSATADAAAESVEELVDTGQDFEAAFTEGVEDAADHPGRSLRPRENQGRR